MTTRRPPTGIRLLKPPKAPLPPLPVFPNLRPAFLKWGHGEESLEHVHALAEAHARRLPDWASKGGDVVWVREVVHRWLFDHLFGPLRDELTDLVRSNYRHISSPDDVVSSAYRKAWSRWKSADSEPQWQPIQNPMGALVHMAGFAVMGRSSVKRRVRAQRNGVVPLAATLPANTPSPVEAVEFAERLALLLVGLSEEERDLYQLRIVERLTIVEVAARLGITPAAAQQRATRLKNDLRKMLGYAHK